MGSDSAVCKCTWTVPDEQVPAKRKHILNGSVYDMSRPKKLIYGALAFALLALAANTPGIIQGRKQKRAVDATFEAYSQALVTGDYVGAYQLCGEAFKDSISFEVFVEKQRELQSSYGKLKALERKDTYVHGKGSPMEWTAIIEMNQRYEKGDLHSVCEFHLEDNGWKLFGCKQV